MKVGQGGKGSQGLTENPESVRGKEPCILVPTLPLAVKAQAFSHLGVEVTCWGSRRPAWTLVEASWGAGHCSVAGGLGQPHRGPGWGWEGHPCQSVAHLSGDMCPPAPVHIYSPTPPGGGLRTERGRTADGEGEPWPDHRLRVGRSQCRVHRGHHHSPCQPPQAFPQPHSTIKLLSPLQNPVWGRSCP